MEDALEVPAETIGRLAVHLRTRMGFAPIAAAWTEAGLWPRRSLPPRAWPTETRPEKVAQGLDEDGALRLGLQDGSVRRITAGDVFFGEA